VILFVPAAEIAAGAPGAHSRAGSFTSQQKIGRMPVPTWRVDYFERANGQTPERSIVIATENEAVAFEEVRASMGPTCSRAVVTKVDNDSMQGSPDPT
jgi:hypothetical protein